MPTKIFLGLVLLTSLYAQDSIETRLSKPLMSSKQTLVEAQIYLASRVKPMPPIHDRAAWESAAAEFRREVLANVVFRGEAAKWRTVPVKEEWLDTIQGDGYRLRKFRYQVLPGLWLPGLLYEPLDIQGRIPAVVNLNGHEPEGMATPYIQQRLIHLARNGVLAYNFEWFGKGQMSAAGYDHARLNQLDLAGTSGESAFFLAHEHLLEIALKNPHTDPARVAVTGLSGGGWQTIFLSSLDTRVKLAVPVAGYSSFVTRTQFPVLDLGDSEQTPVDLGRYVDYTHLTAMLAPRPSLIVNNAFDNCCFRADYAPAPLLVAAQPFFALLGQPGHLRYHPNFDQGHNYGLDNRQAFYRFLGEFFFGGKFPDEERPADVRQAADLRVPMPDANEDLHTIAVKLSDPLPRQPEIPTDPQALGRWQAEYRKKLRDVTRWTDYRVIARPTDAANPGWLFSMNGNWTVPALEFSAENPTGTVLVLGDSGKAKLAAEIGRLVAQKQRVIALDPFYVGECKIETRGYLFALLVSALGERPLGIQAGQVAAIARWARQKYGPVAVEAFGPHTSLIALVAAGVESDAIREVKLHQPMSSLKEPIQRDMVVSAAPELFCFGLLEWFDMKQLAALTAPRPLSQD